MRGFYSSTLCDYEVISMLGNWQSHHNYQSFLLDSLDKLKVLHSTSLIKYQEGISKLYLLNLDVIKDLITPLYSNTGRPSNLQAQIFRSYILMNHLHIYSVTKWCRFELPNDPILCAAIGVTPDSIPSVGSHYDFISRLIPLNDSPKLKSVKRKPTKKYKKGEKMPPKNPNVVEKLVNFIINNPDKSYANHPQSMLQRIFTETIVIPSAAKGLLGDTSKLTVSADGTCLVSGASSSAVKVCKCKENGIYDCKCDRRFSDPLASWGWDSHNSRYFYGYTGYYAGVYNPDAKIDLPVYLRIFDANRHDSTSSVVAINELRHLVPDFNINSYVLDSASDNYATYTLLNHWNINAIIALNARNKHSKYDSPLSFDKKGIPICKAGHPMVFWGNCPGRHRIKWRCPLKTGKLSECKCSNDCSPSPYGRTVYTKPLSDLRLFTKIPRNSDLFKTKMASRTCCERINNRILHNYGLENSKVRGKKRIAFWSTVCAFNIHLDAWLKCSNFSILSLLNI